MMMGSLLGGISFHKGLGVVHAISHAIGSQGRVHHGTLNAVLLAHLHSASTARPRGARMAELAGRLSLGRGGDATGHLITLTELVLARLPLPRRLGQIEGLHRDQIPEYAPGSPCSTTATAPTLAFAFKATWKTCSTGPGRSKELRRGLSENDALGQAPRDQFTTTRARATP